MIRDLVVNLGVGTDRDWAAQFAISIAAAFEAHIAGIAFAYDPAMTPTLMDGLSAGWISRPLRRLLNASRRPSGARASLPNTGSSSRASARPRTSSPALPGISIFPWSARPRRILPCRRTS
jgi:hypothetical protein